MEKRVNHLFMKEVVNPIIMGTNVPFNPIKIDFNTSSNPNNIDEVPYRPIHINGPVYCRPVKFDFNIPLDMVYYDNDFNESSDSKIIKTPIPFNPITILESTNFIGVDRWVPEPQDIYFTHTRGSIILPISAIYGKEPGPIDYFSMQTTKRCYNSDTIRNHISQYLNYFEKFYDPEKELIAIYQHLKIIMDCYSKDAMGNSIYPKDAFLNDIKKRIIHNNSIRHKIRLMNDDNYKLHLNYENTKNPALQYNNKHGKILLEISLMINMIIPLATHYVHSNPDINIKDLLLEIYDEILSMYEIDADIYSKLYETAFTNTKQNAVIHKVLWDMQEIRGINPTTHSLGTIESLLLQIIPKYIYEENIIPYNYKAVQKNINYQVTGVGYEYKFVPFSSSIRDEDNNSEFDKFESHLIKQDESLYLQNNVSCKYSEQYIEREYGEFKDEEIDFYIRELEKGGSDVIKPFQKNLIFLLFYKYFGDTITIRGINKRQYVILMIAAKRILLSYEMKLLPYIISSKVVKIAAKKSINKKELMKIQTSNYYNYIKEKYNNNVDILEGIENKIANIISSEFRYIDYYKIGINGERIEIDTDILIDEFLQFISLI